MRCGSLQLHCPSGNIIIMNLLNNNKLVVVFLCLVVLVFCIWPQPVEAGFFKSFFRAVFKIVTIVAITVISAGFGAVLVGAAFAAVGVGAGIAGTIVGGLIGAAVGISWATQCVVPTNPVGQVSIIPMCGSSSGSSAPTWNGAVGSPVLQNQTITPVMSSDGNCTTGFILNYNVTDAYSYAIYRGGDMIRSGTINAAVQPSPYNASFSYTDGGLAANSTSTYELSLADRNGTAYRYPQMEGYTACIKLDLKLNGTDGPVVLGVPNNSATLSWITERAESCTASGDWSGAKGPASGSQNLGRTELARGTSNPGSGKAYNYVMLCNYPAGRTISDSVAVTVFKRPVCSFSANPATISALPATSTLSWDCRYSGITPVEGADSCSINHGIGSVNPSFGFMSVRPSEDTTYALTCNAIDGSVSYSASVGVSGSVRIREVLP